MFINRLFKMKKKKLSTPKKGEVRVYAIYHSPSKELNFDDKKGIPVPEYYASTKEEAIEVINRCLYKDHFSHFKTWLDFHEEKLEKAGIEPYNTDNIKYRSKAWNIYLNSIFKTYDDGLTYVVPDGDKYTVATLSYTAAEVSIFLRMLTASHPLGMPTETSEEIANYLMFYSINADTIPESLEAFAMSDPEFFKKLAKASAMVDFSKTEKNK